VLEGRWSLSTDEKQRVVWVKEQEGTIIARLRHEATVILYRFSVDGKSVVTMSDDGLLRAWLWRPEDLLERACRVVSRGELTEQEWQEAFWTEPRRVTCQKTP
jgi:hypothetical protein